MALIAGIHPLTREPIVLYEPRKAAAAAPVASASRPATTGPMKIAVVFARLNVIDSDGDVTLPGAFPTRSVLLSQWGHGSWEPALVPIGKGTIREEGELAVFRGEFFDTLAGRETFAAIKAGGELIEYSYGYRVLDGEKGSFQGQYVRFLKLLDVSEVSPVLKGAGVRTGTIETSGLSPVSLEIAASAHRNELALSGVEAAAKRVIGWTPDGLPVRLAGAMGPGRIAAGVGRSTAARPAYARKVVAA